jgi:hypothetical protein
MSCTRSDRSHLPARIESLENRRLLAADPLTVIVGSGAAKSVMFTDASGTQAQIMLSGPGTASVNFDGTGLSQSANAKGLVVNGSDISVASITVNGTTALSNFQILTTKNKALTIGDITVGGGLNGLLARSVTVAGDITTGSGVHILQLGGASDGTITIGSGKVGTIAVQVGAMNNVSFNSAIPVTTLVASQWVNGTGEDLSITAPTINAVNISHDLTADVTTGSIISMNVRGNISSSTFNLTTPLTPLGKSIKSMNVGGGIAGTTINAGGNVGSVNAGSMTDSFLYAGLVASPSGAFPSVTTDFRNTATIFAVNLRKGASASFSNSVIAGYNVNAVNLGTVSQNNGGNAFGVAAHDVMSVTIKDLATGKTVHVSNPPTTTTFTNTLAAKSVTPGDLEVLIV